MASSNKYLIPFIVILGFMAGCFVMEQPYSQLPPGPWRGTLKLDPQKDLMENTPRETSVRTVLDFDEVTEGDLPFNFEIGYTSEDSLYMTLTNGDQIIQLTDIRFNHDRDTNKDTVLIRFPNSQAFLSALFEDNVMEGHFSRSPSDLVPVSFVAHHGQNHRFTLLKKEPTADLNGRWDMSFYIETDQPSVGSLEIVQTDNELRASLLLDDNLYAHLEGTIQANKIYLSSFDGLQFLLVEGKIGSDGNIEGVIRNSTSSFITWRASR